ncbi:hypothetical protein BCR37DRAFT_389772 [Protomyces lactucae-debilis]|uniref:Uncharacterized protein n=1 Tax=Protomyces lactucae-debilis TaxID=2754530 RepID=A0A1Y2ETA8_PROLT|nr:uncharacterized protein BCR37DRAFT_389772 [Protomyces lactucae-debilis]ORY74799.1 hypothetical protein BCR37DRAFT_389772 [Protomyces lactucae-debilis]
MRPSLLFLLSVVASRPIHGPQDLTPGTAVSGQVITSPTIASDALVDNVQSRNDASTAAIASSDLTDNSIKKTRTKTKTKTRTKTTNILTSGAASQASTCHLQAALTFCFVAATVLAEL